MFLTKLELSNFRNYKYISFFPEHRVVIVGNNGEGKTNLIEALFLLINGRSFRANVPESFILHEASFAKISADFVQQGRKDRVEMALDGSGKKKVYFNGKLTTSAFISRQIALILFSPESLTLLKGSAEQRRAWMDQWLGIRGEDRCVREFKKTLIQKNKLLAQIKKGLISKKQGGVLQESLNDIFLQKSLYLSQAREKSLKEIEVFFQKRVFDFLREKIVLEENFSYLKYKRQSTMEQREKKPLREIFQKKLEENFFKEQERGTSLYGAHLEDFQIFLNNKDSKFFCSQGEQRALLLGLKKAQIQWIRHYQKRSVLLLLDDVFSEIDKHFVFNLLHFLEDFSVQMILTSTDVPTWFLKKPFSVFSLKKGTLLKEKESERRHTVPQPFI